MKLSLVVWGLIATTTLSCGGGGGGGGSSGGGASGGSPPGSGLTTTGTLGEPTTALIAGNLIFVNASMNMMNQDPGSFGMLIDSGSPVVLIDPSLFNTTPPTMAEKISTTVDLGLLDAAGQPVVVIDSAPVLQVSNAMMDALGFGGILGGSVMSQFSVQLDYAASTMEGFCLGCNASTTRTDVQLPGGVVPFTLKGGGRSPVTLGTDSHGNSINSPVVNIPPTRIPVTVTMDGTDHPFILDTGATEVSLRSTVYDQLISDGRAQLVSGIAIMTISGSSNASLTRAKTMTVGDSTVSNVPVMTIMTTPADQLLDGISNELGMQIDGLLGGSFLRNFLVSIDYPNGQLHLQPYLTPPIPDEFRRVGITIGLDITGSHFVVSSVYPNTDAASKNINVNDQVVSIDGASLANIGYVADADQLLDGMPDTSKMIRFGKTKDSALTNMTVSVLVDDLIPNP